MLNEGYMNKDHLDCKAILSSYVKNSVKAEHLL